MKIPYRWLVLGLLLLPSLACRAADDGEPNPPPAPVPAAADARERAARLEAEAARLREEAARLEENDRFDLQGQLSEVARIRSRRRDLEDQIRSQEDRLAAMKASGAADATIASIATNLTRLYGVSERITDLLLAHQEIADAMAAGESIVVKVPEVSLDDLWPPKSGNPDDGSTGRASSRSTPSSRTVGGLAWLAAHQSPDGSWDSDGYQSRCTDRLCEGSGGPLFDVGLTGLALVAFLGTGETHKTPRYGKVVRDGFKYLKSVQDPDGVFGPRTSQHHIYNHAIATLAMCEVYGLTQSPLFKGSAQAGVDWLLKAQNPYMGWRYGERPGDNDTSVTGWCVMALKSAHGAGLRVDPVAFQGVNAFIEKVTDSATGRIGYTQVGNGPARPVEWMDRYPSEKSEALTAVGSLARIYCGVDPKDPSVRRAMALVLANPPHPVKEGRADHIAYFFGTMLAFHVGGDAFKDWQAEVVEPWSRSMRPEGEGCTAGSWDPVGPWGSEGGRIFSTALCTMAESFNYNFRHHKMVRESK